MIDELEMHFSDVKTQLQKKRREFLMSELVQRSSGNFMESETTSEFRPLRSRMAPRHNYSSRQAQHDIDVSLVREIRANKKYVAKWFVAAEVHAGEMAV